MIDALFNQPNYIGAKKMLEATVLRHEALASNIANLETPGYKRLDLTPNFATELQRAIASGGSAQINSLTPTLAPDASAMPIRPDGNTVRLENELLQMNQNSVQHNLETQLLTGAVAKLRLAITGRLT